MKRRALILVCASIVSLIALLIVLRQMFMVQPAFSPNGEQFRKQVDEIVVDSKTLEGCLTALRAKGMECACVESPEDPNGRVCHCSKKEPAYWCAGGEWIAEIESSNQRLRVNRAEVRLTGF